MLPETRKTPGRHIIAAEHLVKKFGDIAAVNDIAFSVGEGGLKFDTLGLRYVYCRGCTHRSSFWTVDDAASDVVVDYARLKLIPKYS